MVLVPPLPQPLVHLVWVRRHGWSSGRAPAALNGLFAYTPSRGIISVVGNWPLVPTMDVVVPHTRSMADMLEVLDILIIEGY